MDVYRGYIVIDSCMMLPVAGESVTALFEWVCCCGAWDFSVVVAVGVAGLTWWWLECSTRSNGAGAKKVFGTYDSGFFKVKLGVVLSPRNRFVVC